MICWFIRFFCFFFFSRYFKLFDFFNSDIDNINSHKLIFEGKSVRNKSRL
ncbi:hypothetical protein HanRHA438_Chr15g0732251 [Helianthus annuus]|nr:hypothetical protein HanRHA438_Chr15g0732251 [Helianthus annuus]